LKKVKNRSTKVFYLHEDMRTLAWQRPAPTRRFSDASATLSERTIPAGTV